jgi:hypothetical protein
MENCFSHRVGNASALFCIGFRAIPHPSSAVYDSTLHEAYGTVRAGKIILGWKSYSDGMVKREPTQAWLWFGMG